MNIYVHVHVCVNYIVQTKGINSSTLETLPEPQSRTRPVIYSEQIGHSNKFRIYPGSVGRLISSLSTPSVLMGPVVVVVVMVLEEEEFGSLDEMIQQK